MLKGLLLKMLFVGGITLTASILAKFGPGLIGVWWTRVAAVALILGGLILGLEMRRSGY